MLITASVKRENPYGPAAKYRRRRRHRRVRGKGLPPFLWYQVVSHDRTMRRKSLDCFPRGMQSLTYYFEGRVFRQSIVVFFRPVRRGSGITRVR